MGSARAIRGMNQSGRRESDPGAERVMDEKGKDSCPQHRSLTVIVPAFNEAASVGDTIRSIRAQTIPPDEVLVVDDCSNDGTGEVARACGATVLRPPRNTGSKAGAQTFALRSVDTEFCMAIDADTVLAPDAIERLMSGFERPEVAAACGMVVPRRVRTIFERGRYIEYLFAFAFYKPIQNFYGRPLISSGCFSAYRTAILRRVGGWSTRTLAEDMDLTWTLYQAGHDVCFIPDAVCFPLEPHNYHYMSRQLRRWSHGFVQNVRLHWRDVVREPHLCTLIAVAMWDAAVASVAYLILLPTLAIGVNPLFLLGYLIDLPAVAVPVLVIAVERREIGRAFASLPCFVIQRLLNAFHMLKALWAEIIVGRSLLVYEKGH